MPGQAAVCYGTIQSLSGRRASFGESLGKGFSQLVAVLGVSLLAGLLIAVGSLLILPGILLLCGLYVAVVERLSLKGTLKRSFALTRGHWGSILFAYLGLRFLEVLVSILCVHFLGGLLGDPLLAWILRQVVLVLFTAIGAVLTGVAYVLLRERKEGVQVAELAQVFA